MTLHQTEINVNGVYDIKIKLVIQPFDLPVSVTVCQLFSHLTSKIKRLKHMGCNYNNLQMINTFLDLKHQMLSRYLALVIIQKRP